MKIKLTNISLILLFLLGVFGLVSCRKKDTGTAFVPCLDTASKCKIEIAGRYQNFEALEAEFDRFNEIYPNVELSYTYLDNYKVTISTALVGTDAPDIFMTFPYIFDPKTMTFPYIFHSKRNDISILSSCLLLPA